MDVKRKKGRKEGRKEERKKEERAENENGPLIQNGPFRKLPAFPAAEPSVYSVRLRGKKAVPNYSCAGSGSIVSGFTGTCTSSRCGDVNSVTRIRGNAFMNWM